MLFIPTSIKPADLEPLLVDGAHLVFEGAKCTAQIKQGQVIGDSPYGYIDYMGPADANALVLWARAWSSFNPSCAC